MKQLAPATLALVLSASGCFAQLNVTASSHIVVMQYEAWFGPNAVGFEGSPSQPLLASASMRAAGRPGYDSADPQVIAQHAQWLTAMGVDAVLADLTNGVNCTFFQVWLPYCGDAPTYAKFQTIKANTGNLYPAFNQLGTNLKIVPLVGGFEAIDFNTDTNGKTALEEELDWFSGLTAQYPNLNVLLDGKPLVVIYVGCAQPLDPTAIWRMAQAEIPKYPNLTLRLMAADLDDQPPLWANANGLAGLREINQANPFWSWVDRLNPIYNLLPSYLPGPSGPENLTASVATLSTQLGWGDAATGVYAPEDALSLGGATFRAFVAYAQQVKPAFLLVHQWNEYAENGWDAETDTDIEPSTFFGTTMMVAVQQAITAYKTVLAPASSAISFGAIGNVTFGVSPFPISATATSGLPVTFTSMTPQICTVSASTVTILAMGTCSITASQAGNISYAAATPVTQSFPINPAGVTLGATGQPLPVNFSALGTSTGGVYPSVPVSFTVTPCPACSGTWTASSSAAWVSICSGAGGTGVGAVGFNVFANTNMAARSAAITITAAGAAPVSLTINEAGSIQSLLNRETQALYQRSLGREPDTSGFSFWTCTTPATVSPCSLLGVGGLGQMVDLFLENPEGMSGDFQVLALYQAFLGRLPVFSEWSGAIAPFRANDTQTGWNAAAAALIATLVNSSEYAGRYGPAGNTSNAVANLYQNMLHRQPSNTELVSGIAAAANSGLSGPFAVVFTGAEFQNTGGFASLSTAADHSNGMFVTMIYFAVLARDPDILGYSFWLGVANSGGSGIYFQPMGTGGANTRYQVEGPGTPGQGLVGSIEFQSQFAN
jgi:hypothetical protein